MPLLHDEAVEELDLGAPALDHVLAHRRAVCAAAGPFRLGQAVLVVLRPGGGVALAGRAMISGSMWWISSSS